MFNTRAMNYIEYEFRMVEAPALQTADYVSIFKDPF